MCYSFLFHDFNFFLQLTKTDLLSDAHVVSDSKKVSNEEKKNKLEETHDGDIR